MINKKTFKFLEEIRENNNRDWFIKNKPRFEVIKKELNEFSDEWIPHLRGIDESLLDPDIKGYLFRIYKDARFNKGAPYKSNLGLLVLRGGKPALHSRAGFYLHIEPGHSFVVGGAYSPPKEWLGAIRDSFVKDASKFKKIINSAAFKSECELVGPKLKTGPRGYDKDHKEVELLKFKGWMAISYFSDKELQSPDFMKNLMKACKAIAPFNAYLNNCTYQRPEELFYY